MGSGEPPDFIRCSGAPPSPFGLSQPCQSRIQHHSAPLLTSLLHCPSLLPKQMLVYLCMTRPHRSVPLATQRCPFCSRSPGSTEISLSFLDKIEQAAARRCRPGSPTVGTRIPLRSSAFDFLSCLFIPRYLFTSQDVDGFGIRRKHVVPSRLSTEQAEKTPGWRHKKQRHRYIYTYIHTGHPHPQNRTNAFNLPGFSVFCDG